MKWITLLLPMLSFVSLAHAETALPAPEVRLIRIHPALDGNGMHLGLQIKPQKDVCLAGAVEVAGPLMVTDEKGDPLETLEARALERNRPVDQVLFLTCKTVPQCDWFRVGGTLRVTQGGDVRRGAWHTCPTNKESSFTEGGINFSVNGEADLALAEHVWNKRIPQGMVCVSCNAADACRIKSWGLEGRKGMELGFVHRETRQVEGRNIWFLGYDSLQREVRLRPDLFSAVQTIEIPVDCIVGINGQAKEVSPLPEGDSTPAPRLQVESVSWNDDDFPGMVGMVAGSQYALTIKLSVEREEGMGTGLLVGAPEREEITVTDATGKHIPCRIQTNGDKIHLLFRDARPQGTWLKLEGAGLDGIYTLRGRRH